MHKIIVNSNLNKFAAEQSLKSIESNFKSNRHDHDKSPVFNNSTLSHQFFGTIGISNSPTSMGMAKTNAKKSITQEN